MKEFFGYAFAGLGAMALLLLLVTWVAIPAQNEDKWHKWMKAKHCTTIDNKTWSCPDDKRVTKPANWDEIVS